MILCTSYYKSSTKSTSEALAEILTNDTVIVCIGTDKCIADAIGPMVGTLLKHYRWDMPVYGTIDDPVHGLNITDTLETIKKEHSASRIIAIDASIGLTNESVGQVRLKTGPIKPGKALNKELPPVGDYSIVGIVNHKDTGPFLSGVRLSLIMKMSDHIAKALIEARSISQNNHIDSAFRI